MKYLCRMLTQNWIGIVLFFVEISPRKQYFLSILPAKIFFFLTCLGFALNAWIAFAELGKDTYTGAYQVLVFVDSFLIIGQAIIVFLIFGLNLKYIKVLFGKLRERLSWNLIDDTEENNDWQF